MNTTGAVALGAIGYLAFALLASPLIEGVMRKIKAVVHSRKGPPVWQPYLDLAKLLVKEDLSSQAGVVTRFAPPAAFASALVACFFVPFGVAAPAGAAGDLFLFVYLITLSSTCVMAGALAQRSPFSHVGASREMMMVLTVEAVLVISLLVVALGGRTALLTPLTGVPFHLSFLLGLICYFFAMQAMLGKLPFDIPEAEQEIMEGPFIEYSGPSLALFRWTFYVKQLVFASLFLNVFVGLPHVAGAGTIGWLANVAMNYAGVLGVSVLVVLVDATNPRLRIDQSMRFFAGLIGVSLVGAGLAAFGL